MRPLAALLLFSAACVGDAPAGGANDASPEAAPDAAVAEAGPDAVVDSAPPCDAAVCSGSCVDLGTSSQHCGVCGHSCGGGACAAGQCQPEVFQDSLGEPVHLSVDATGLYYSSDHFVEKCGLDTCKPSPTQLWDNGVNQYVDGVGVSAGNLYFFGNDNSANDYAYRCPNTGCIAPTLLGGPAGFGFLGPYMSGGDVYFNPGGSTTSIKHAACSGACASTETLTSASVSGSLSLVADGTSIFVLQVKTNQIFKCPASGAGTCAMTTAFMGSPGKPITGLGIVGNTLYVLVSGDTGYTNGSIRVCPTSAATCNPSTFIDKLGYPQTLAVDANGLYWYAADEQAFKSCPISGCVNGQHTVAKNVTLPLPVELRVGGGALYWVVQGSTLNTTKIMRVAY